MTINADKTTIKTADARENRARIEHMARTMTRNMTPEQRKMLIATLEKLVQSRS